MILDDLKYHFEKAGELIERLQKANKKLADDCDYWKNVANKQKPYEKEPFWTTEEVADYFRISNSQVIAAVNQHKIPAINVSFRDDCRRSTFRFKREDIYKIAKNIATNMKN